MNSIFCAVSFSPLTGTNLDAFALHLIPGWKDAPSGQGRRLLPVHKPGKISAGFTEFSQKAQSSESRMHLPIATCPGPAAAASIAHFPSARFPISAQGAVASPTEARAALRAALASSIVGLKSALRAYPQIVAPVSRPAVLAASKPPEAMSASLETCTTAALESGATESAIYG
jgi:hypothetical protein